MSAYTTLTISSKAAERFLSYRMNNLNWSQLERILDILLENSLYKVNINCMKDGRDDEELTYLKN
jgi:hypothetical protein